MIQTTPRDVRELRPGDLIQLVEATHRVHRARPITKQRGSWTVGYTELLHEIVGEPGLIQTSIPHGAKVRVVIPI